MRKEKFGPFDNITARYHLLKYSQKESGPGHSRFNVTLEDATIREIFPYGPRRGREKTPAEILEIE